MFNVGQKVKINEGLHKGSVGKITSRLPFQKIDPDLQHYTILLKNGRGSVVGLYDLQLDEVK